MMIASALAICLAVTAGVTKATEDVEAAEMTPSVQVINSPSGDYTITVNGGVQWKETITVKKTSAESSTGSAKSKEDSDSGLEKYHIETCCNIPSNQTSNETIEIYMRCLEGVKEEFEGLHKTNPREQLNIYNCLLQCACHGMGLSDKYGDIKFEEMVEYVSSDNRQQTIGISKEMVGRCIRTAKVRSRASKTSGGRLCNTSNMEIIMFVKCISDLENLYCPLANRIQTKSCERNRQVLKKRHHEKY
ncbi:uncharacterized protein [Periplaneta americana]|uniref:uncharacterized protein isoform X2 n=1 Tax=Periplaneta americana TaxID=6978 RepID=UPI0037E77DD2